MLSHSADKLALLHISIRLRIGQRSTPADLPVGGHIDWAVAKVLKATWQRCRVHFMRNARAHAGKIHRRMVAPTRLSAVAR